MAELKKGKSQFTFIGRFKKTDRAFGLEELSSSGFRYNKMNMQVDTGRGNSVYANMMGGYSEEKGQRLYVHGVKKREDGTMVSDWENKFDIDFEDRENEDLLEQIGEMCFIRIGIVKDTKGNIVVKKFLSPYDAIAYISENLEDDIVVNVKGNLKYSIYKEGLKIDKEIKSIFLSNVEKEEDFKAEFIQTLLVDRKSVGKVDTKKNIIPISARVLEYDKTRKQIAPFVVDYELQFTDEESLKKQERMAEILFKTSKDITEVTVIGSFVESVQLVNIEDLNIDENTKYLIDAGIISMEVYKRKAIGSEKKERHLVILQPDLRKVTVGEEEVAQISIDHGKYKESDLIIEEQKKADVNSLNSMLDSITT